MKITEEVLKELGFVQQNPPHIWDYPLGGKFFYGEQMFRFVKQAGDGKENWSLHYGKDFMYNCNDVMSMVMFIATTAQNRGVRETQDKLHDALGLHRLVEAVVEATHRDE